jgi:hypothetical protein
MPKNAPEIGQNKYEAILIQAGFGKLTTHSIFGKSFDWWQWMLC